MTDFNLRTLYDFRPASYLCFKCLALLDRPPMPARVTSKAGERELLPNPKCPFCGVEYLATKTFNKLDADKFLADNGLELEFENVLKHCLSLAKAISGTRITGAEATPMHSLLSALNAAKYFVHFTSYGISEFFIGALKLLAHRVPVRGIVANVDERTLDELTLLTEDTPLGQFQIQHFLRGEDWAEFPHQKLIVIDGLLAFKGSANMTTNGWRKAAKGRDHVEVVSKVGEVIELHNKLFSPIWAERSKVGSQVPMKAWWGD
jgi:hypothetical protein